MHAAAACVRPPCTRPAALQGRPPLRPSHGLLPQKPTVRHDALVPQLLQGQAQPGLLCGGFCGGACIDLHAQRTGRSVSDEACSARYLGVWARAADLQLRLLRLGRGCVLAAERPHFTLSLRRSAGAAAREAITTVAEVSKLSYRQAAVGASAGEFPGSSSRAAAPLHRPPLLPRLPPRLPLHAPLLPAHPHHQLVPPHRHPRQHPPALRLRPPQLGV